MTLVLHTIGRATCNAPFGTPNDTPQPPITKGNTWISPKFAHR